MQEKAHFSCAFSVCILEGVGITPDKEVPLLRLPVAEAIFISFLIYEVQIVALNTPCELLFIGLEVAVGNEIVVFNRTVRILANRDFVVLHRPFAHCIVSIERTIKVLVLLELTIVDEIEVITTHTLL